MNYQKQHKKNRDNTTKKAYKPKAPFMTVEGAESAAWTKLSPHAVWVLMEFYRRFNGYNRSCLTLSYGDVQYKMAYGTFNKAIWELMGFGFIDVIKNGSLERNNSVYALSNRWKKLSELTSELARIEKLLTEIEKTKHLVTPKEYSEEAKAKFREHKRTLINKLRYEIINGGWTG
jgi:hypothetical protein